MDEINTLYRQGMTFLHAGNLDSAEQIYKSVIEKERRHAGAHHFLGIIHYMRKDYQQALLCIKYALCLCDTQATFFNNYGTVLKKLGRSQEALDAFEKAVALAPEYADALANIASLLDDLRQAPLRVEELLKQALHATPDHRPALSLLSDLYHRQDRHAEALDLEYRKVRLFPDDPEVHGRILKLLATLGRHEEAFHFGLNSPMHDKDHPETLHFLATQLGESGRYRESRQYFQRAALLGQGKIIWKWKHTGYAPVIFNDTSEIDGYWHDLNCDLDAAIAEEKIYDWRNLPYDGFSASFNLPHHFRCCRTVKEKFSSLFEKSFPFRRADLKPESQRNGKIRIGFLVTPGHEGGFVRMMRGVIEGLNPSQFEIFLFAHKDFMGRLNRIVAADNISRQEYDWSFERTVNLFHETRCDIFYHWKVAADLWSTFLPMTYPAPIQCTAWGTHGTGGIRHVDYSLTWDAAEVGQAQEHYTEQLVRLKTAPNYEHRQKHTRAACREELGLPEKGAIYFCPHRLPKYHPQFDFYFKDILREDAQGHILLLCGRKGAEVQENLKNRLRRNLGETLFSRLIFLPVQSVQFYYRYLSISTMVLDSPAYSGELTCYDAFATGIPCVTQSGDLLVQRYSTAHYEKMGISGPATTTKSDYVAQAVRLATDDDYHHEIRSLIKERHDVLLEDHYVISEYELFFKNAIQSRQ